MVWTAEARLAARQGRRRLRARPEADCTLNPQPDTMDACMSPGWSATERRLASSKPMRIALPCRCYRVGIPRYRRRSVPTGGSKRYSTVEALLQAGVRAVRAILARTAFWQH